MSDRVRGIWGDAGPPLTPLQMVAAEVDEAFASVRHWRFSTRAERSTELYLEATSALLTLSCWGWKTSMTQTAKGWTITASRDVGGRSLKAQVQHQHLIEAIGHLGERLTADLAKLDRQQHEPKELAA